MTEVREVMIDGIKYVPSNQVDATQIQTMRKTLESVKYLSSSAIDDIMKAFEKNATAKKTQRKANSSKKRKSYPNSWDLQFKYNGMHRKLFNISGVLSNGAVLYKRRTSPASWNIQQAMVIRKAMNNDTTEGMTYRDAKELQDNLNLSNNLVRKIMYNIEFGNLTKFIDEWSVKFNQKPHIGGKPIQNNPQKRRESGGLYG